MTVNQDAKKVLWLIVYVLWMVLDVEGVWDRSRLLCILIGFIGTSCIAFAEFDTVKPAMAVCGLALIASIAIYWQFGANASPFLVVTSATLFSRHFPHGPDPGPPINAYAFHRGVLVAASDAPNTVGQGVDLLIHLAITNQDKMPRRITEYGLEVSGSLNGPWTVLCQVNFKFANMFLIGEKNALSWSSGDLLDNHLTEHAIQMGDTISGWTGWICPLDAPNECTPAFLRYTLYNSLGERSQYTESNTQDAAKPLHDWSAEAILKPQKANRDFSGQNILVGNCNSPGTIVTEPVAATNPIKSWIAAICSALI